MTVEERARNLAFAYWGRGNADLERFVDLASRALTEYGNQRAREAVKLEVAGTPAEIAEDWTPKPNDRIALAKEIVAYGGQRAREAAKAESEKAQLESISDICPTETCWPRCRVNITNALEKCAREARAAVVEEAVLLVDKFEGYRWKGHLSKVIRALAEREP